MGVSHKGDRKPNRTFSQRQNLSRSDPDEPMDVIFEVGRDPEVWRIPGNRKQLAQSNPVMRAMLEGTLAHKEPVIKQPDVDCRAFNLLLRQLLHKEVTILSVPTALETIYVAHKYQSVELVEKCVRYIDRNLTPENVLEVYLQVMKYSSGGSKLPQQTNDLLPSAPAEELMRSKLDLTEPSDFQPLLHSGDTTSRSLWYWVDALINNCLDYFDRNADVMLANEYIEFLDHGALRRILQRDTLQVDTELTVFNAFSRWCECQCRRLMVEPTPDNCRLVANGLQYEVRYLTMNVADFFEGPIKSEILDTREANFIWSSILQKEKLEVPTTLQQHIEKLQTPRVKRSNASIPLSSRSQSIDSTDIKKDKCWGKEKKKKKVLKEKMSKEKFQKKGSVESEGDKSPNSCGQTFFTVLSCIFD